MVNPVNAAAAYATTAANSVTPGMAARGGPSFGDALEEVAQSAVGVLKRSETMSAKAAVGQADLTDVVQAVSNAEVTLQTVTAVRDKVLNAYQEIMRMPI